MVKVNGKLIGVLVYLICLSLIFRFEWVKLLNFKALMAVFTGVVILTLSQFSKSNTRQKTLQNARWNAFFAGLITSLLSFLSVISNPNQTFDGYLSKAVEALIPLIYGSILYLMLDFSVSAHKHVSTEITEETEQRFAVKNIHEVLKSKGFSPREIHVALKIIEELSNKEIASQLYISEPTVKKHIQNMFKKCGAKDRHDFIELVNRWLIE